MSCDILRVPPPFGTNTAHACSQTTVELKDDEFVENTGILDLRDVFVIDDLFGIGGVDSIPFAVDVRVLEVERGEYYISLPLALSLR